MIYVTGDTHGDAKRLSKRNLAFMKPGDTLIICGDFGFLWSGSASERRALKRLGERDYNICFADGTHENFDLFGEFKVSVEFGGHVQRITGNVFHLLRGEVYDIEGTSVFVMGGGDPDREDIVPGELPGENAVPAMPTKAQMLRGAENLEKRGMKVDAIITHMPPAAIRDFVMPQSAGTSESSALSSYLTVLSQTCQYRSWYFGSLHIDKHISAKQTAVFRKVYDLATGAEVY